MGMFDWQEKSADVLAQGGVIGPHERLPWPQTWAGCWRTIPGTGPEGRAEPWRDGDAGAVTARVSRRAAAARSGGRSRVWRQGYWTAPSSSRV